ncbi:MAG: alpha/beta fold hydrolase, partial [Burkholderiaceae bacterium]
GKFLFLNNKRDKRSFDVFEADIASRSTRMIGENDSTVSRWIIDMRGRIAGRVRRTGPEDGADRIVEINAALLPGATDNNPTWREIQRINGFDSFYVIRIEPDNARAYVSSNVGRDKTALIEMDLAEKTEKVVFEDSSVDIGPVYFRRAEEPPYAVVTSAGLSKLNYLNGKFGADLSRDIERAVEIVKEKKWITEPQVWARPSTLSDDARFVLFRSYGQLTSGEWLLDRDKMSVVPLRMPETEATAILSPMEPFSFKASDGLTINGYLRRPRGVKGPVPLVVIPHGGPRARDYWRNAWFNPRQVLVNRGYAVLTVNYRGSSGYGKSFMNAGDRKMWSRVQQDIAEAVQWAIDEKIADPQALAALGGSFGGFSVLMQLIDKPHAYQCGVNIVGVSNWPRILKSKPPYWRGDHFYKQMYGDPNNPADAKAMWEGSPMSRIDKIDVPLLVFHGANDVRVVKQDSDDVVAALRKLNRPVQYVVYKNEGHSVRRWRNKLDMWRRIEDFFADCLGGRSYGFDYYQLVPK